MLSENHSLSTNALPVKEYLRQHLQFALLLLVWYIAGYVGGGPAATVVVIGSMFLLKRRGMYRYLFMGFWFILIMSDNNRITFAASVKPIYLIVLATFFFFDTRSFRPFNKLYLIFLPFFILAFMLVTRSETVVTSLQKTVSYLLLVFIVPNYLTKLYRDHGEIIFKDIVYLGVIILLIGFPLILINQDLAFLRGRYRGYLGNPNGVGTFCTMLLLTFYTIRYKFKNLFTREEDWIILGVIFISVVFAGSRNAMISILIFFAFWRFFKYSPFIAFIILISIVILNELILSNIDNIVIALGLGEFLREETLEDASGRLVAWQFAWEFIQDNLVLGKGFAFDEFVFFDRQNKLRLSLLGHQGNAHNSYLTFWLNTGIVGVGLFFGAFVTKFVQGAKQHTLAFPILFAVLFSINFESWLMASLNPFTIQLFIIITLLTGDFEQTQAKAPDPVS